LARCEAVLFDLLSALLDSWSLWSDVAGGAEAGRRWREALLARTSAAGAYRDYETLVAEAARAAGLEPARALELVARWDELRPWPEAPAALASLRGRVKTAVVTNCSEALGARALAALGAAFDAVVTAERAGFYKPDPRPYALALRELGLPVARALFVAGSAYDLLGGARAGLAVVWHNPLGLQVPRALQESGAPPPRAESSSLRVLLESLEDGDD
jgi:2-haloalkanoic acid dehalogenase type II